jgi:hypothetical protein
MILIILLFVGGLVMTVLYILQFYVELDGKKENIIKDGLIRELMTKATADPDPTSFIINTDEQTIEMDKIVIRKHWANMFWFPYEVITRGSYSWENGTVGYVTRYSKDYKHINALLKKSKVGIEQTQRQKLNLNK